MKSLQLRANKIPRKSDLEIEPPMHIYPNFSFTREVSLKKISRGYMA